MSTATKEVIVTRLKASKPPMTPPISAPEVVERNSYIAVSTSSIIILAVS